MDNSVRRRVFGQLTAVAMAAAAGFMNPAASLRGVPEEVVIELIDDPADEETNRRSLLKMLAKDSRANVREKVAAAAASHAQRSIDEALALIQELCADGTQRVRIAAARSLAAILASVPPLLRLEMVSGWALSQNAPERAAVARALQSRTPVLVSDLALEELSKDRVAEIRALAARAMARRISESPETYARTIERLANDRHPRVARTARRLLGPLETASRYA